mgnify:CR=1 FL=1
MSTLFTVLHIIVAVLLIVVVLLQEGKDPGMRGISGAAPDTGDSFFSKNTGRTKASMFSKMTATLAVLFLITTMVLVFLQA